MPLEPDASSPRVWISKNERLEIKGVSWTFSIGDTTMKPFKYSSILFKFSALCFFIYPLTSILLPLTSIYAEDVRISTYYPSPFGSYRHLNIEDECAVDPLNPFGSLEIARPGASNGSHIAFIQCTTLSRMGLGYGRNSTTFGFGPAATGPVANFAPTNLAIGLNGMVGIGLIPVPVNGIVTPVDNLHVEESVNSALATQLLLSNSGAGNHGAGLGFQAANEYATYGPKAGIVLERQASFGRGALKFFNSDTASAAAFAATDERMRILMTGEVGIGTTVPVGRLDVVTGAANSNDYFRVNVGGNPGLDLRSGTTGGTPFIDFSNDAATDFHVRLIMNPRGALQIQGNGVVPPSLTTAQRDGLGNNTVAGNKVDGMIIYNTTNREMEYWDSAVAPSGQWRGISGGHMATLSYRGGTQPIPRCCSSLTVPFDTAFVATDPTSFPAVGMRANGNPTYGFTIAKTGIYSITGSAFITPSNQPTATGHGLNIGIILNGANIQQGNSIVGLSTTSTGLSVSGVYRLVANDIVQMQIATTFPSGHSMRTSDARDLWPRMSIVEQD